MSELLTVLNTAVESFRIIVHLESLRPFLLVELFNNVQHLFKSIQGVSLYQIVSL